MQKSENFEKKSEKSKKWKNEEKKI
jgi:hypothetical protein